MRIYCFKDYYDGFGPLLVFDKDVQAARAYVVYLNNQPLYFVKNHDLYLMGSLDPHDGIIGSCPVCLLTGEDAYPYIENMKEEEDYFPDLEEMLK